MALGIGTDWLHGFVREGVSVACVAIAGAVVVPGISHAEADYPSRPISVVVPYAPGGGTDVVARLVANKMSEKIGVPIVVENRSGAGGAVGTSYVARAKPDGYTILLGTASTHAINPALHTDLSYSPTTDFEPISLLVTVPQVIVVNAQLPYKTLPELIEAMREGDGKTTYGSQGVGGIAHLVGETVNRQANVKSTHVPYKGAAPALQDLVSGNIDVLYDTLPALLPHIESGTIRALAVADDQRLSQLPDVPTTSEAGMPKLQASTWNALFAPKGTPQEAIDLLSKAATEAMQDSELRQRLEAMSAQPVGSGAKELEQYVATEIDKWAEAVRLSGAKIE